jgi:transposase-like protein
MAGDNFVVWRERKTEDIGLDSARSRSGPVKVGQASPPDPEVVEKASRRRFTAEYKLRIVREAEACSPGDLGAMLRREGLYFSNLTCWRRQVAQGQLAALTPQKRGRRRQPVNPLSEKVHELERETERLRQRLQQAEEIIDLQKKISDIRGMSLRNLDT